MRKFRLRMDEYDFDRKQWTRLPPNTLEFTITLHDDSDAIWLALEDHLVDLLEEKKAMYEGRKTRR